MTHGKSLRSVRLSEALAAPLFGQHPRADRVQGRAWCAVAGVRYWRTMGYGCGTFRAWAEPEMRRIVESAPSVELLLMRLAGRHGVPVASIVFDPDKPMTLEEAKQCLRTYSSTKPNTDP